MAPGKPPHGGARSRRYRFTNDFTGKPELLAIARHPFRRVFLHAGPGDWARGISRARGWRGRCISTGCPMPRCSRWGLRAPTSPLSCSGTCSPSDRASAPARGAGAAASGGSLMDATTAGVARRCGASGGSLDAGGAAERLILDYEGRFLRRKRLVAASGRAVMVDLPEDRVPRPGGRAGSRGRGRSSRSSPRPSRFSKSPATWPGWPGISATATRPARWRAITC
jgi:hypothetical protein